MAYCLRSFIQSLDQILHPHKHNKKWVLGHNFRPQIQSLFETATFLQDFLDKSSPEIQETMSSLEDQIMDAAQKGADTLDVCVTFQILYNLADPSFTAFPPDLGEVIQVLEHAKQEVSKIKDASQPSDHIMSPPVSSTRYPVSKNMVVGVDQDLNQLRSRLTSRSPELDIIPIVGMGGMGKTTLARILYDEFSSKSHFDHCAWAAVSQSYDPEQILKTLLDCVTKDETPQRQTSDLKTTLYQTLVNRRYLIVLDDIWSSKAWDDVQTAFARDNQGSRIIVTTRNNSLVDYVNSNSHEMHLINEEESWNLLKGKVFGEESCPLELEEVGKRIALTCGGLPLALQVIGGLLAHSRRSKYFWEYVAHNVSSMIAKTYDEFAGIFSWSFANLPHYLKPCFLYMGAFANFTRVSLIIKLWVAEGFLYQIPNKSLEESAMIHLNALADRNLISLNRRWDGKAVYFAIHDLLRDMCMSKAEEKRFLYVKDTRTNIPKEDMLRRHVSIHVPDTCRVIIHVPENGTKYGYVTFNLAPYVRSFILNGHVRNDWFVTRFCWKLALRVLDVRDAVECDFQERFLPLVNLRYLSVSRYSLGYTTEGRGFSILQNLQTLKAATIESLALLEPLPHLRHLQFEHLDDRFYTDSFEVSRHENLHHLSKVPLHKLTCLLEKLPNLRTLKVIVYFEDSDAFDLTCFQKLESLSVLGNETKIVLIFPQSIKKLKLRFFEVNEFGILPRLEFLDLSFCKFENGKWEPSEGEFCQLQYLKIYESNLENWIATDLHFPQLQQLVIKSCTHLNEIPNDFGEIENLESISVDFCMESVFDSARTILKKQLEFGNTLFQLHLGESIEHFCDKTAARQLEWFERHVEDDRLTIDYKLTFLPKTVFPHSLRYLKLENSTLTQTILHAAGVLVELEKFILEKCDFEDSTWEPSEGQFTQLQHLEIRSTRGLFVWLATEIHFPVLKHLVLQNCNDLNEIPTGIGRIETIEIIEVEECKPSLAESARKILENQCKCGNTLLQLRLDGVLMDVPETIDLEKLLEEDVDFLPCEKLTVPNLGESEEDSNMEVNWALLGMGEGLKGLETSSFHPMQDFFLSTESVGLDSGRSYSLDISQGSFANITSAGGQRMRDSNESAGTMASRQKRRKQWQETSLEPFNNSLIHFNSLIQFRLEDDEEEVKWEFPGTGEGSKGLGTQVSSSSFYPSQDFVLTPESLGLGLKGSYSLDSSQGIFGNRTSDGDQRKQNVRPFNCASPNHKETFDESAGTIKQRKATSLKFNPFYIATALAALSP